MKQPTPHKGQSATAPLAASTPGQPKAATPSGFELKRGVNLSHWLSQNFGWSPKDSFITGKDIEFIASVGYDHVRIPIDEPEMWLADGKPSEESFAYLTRCLDWCAKHNLRAVVDLHILKAHHFNVANEGGKITLWTDPVAQDNFIRLWVELSGHLKKYPVDRVAYELMNEPVAEDPEDWNRLIAKAVKAIRQLEPGRVLLMGPNRWQTPENFPFLKVPPNDPNIILSLHTYSPLFFTHHRAYWMAFKDFKGPVHYPGRVVAEADFPKSMDPNNAELQIQLAEARQVFNKQKLAELLRPAIQKARELKLPLYCGEFGCLPHVNRAERLKYYEDIVSVFEENNIGWCNWEYKGDFGILFFDFARNVSLDPDTGLINALMRRP
ncbi:MAG: glycoside hydrolase family 5 protein [Limisphaerales bacterium]